MNRPGLWASAAAAMLASGVAVRTATLAWAKRSAKSFLQLGEGLVTH